MKNIKNYFVDLYETTLYKISMFGANLANKSLLTLINSKGLDPNSDPEQLKQQRLVNELNALFDMPHHHAGRAASKITVPVPWTRNNPRTGYVIKNNYAGASALPDYSNSNDLETVSLKSALKSLVQLAEKLEAKHVVTPATIVPPEATAYVTGGKDCDKNAVDFANKSLLENAGEEVFAALDDKFDKFCDSLADDALESVNEPIHSVLEKISKKKLASKNKSKKTSKKRGKSNKKG